MWHWHHLTPSEFFARGEGEQQLLYAFTLYEMNYRMEIEKAKNKAWAEFFAKLLGAK